MMCGIFGVSGCESADGLDEQAKMLSHRGPDGYGSHFDKQNRVFLAHCRLSIIDLSTAGKQPMQSNRGHLWLTFNGEIYNYRELRVELIKLGYQFSSQSDSEVILHAYEAWGKDCLLKLNGMFAFALWDDRRRELLLVRDRLGIKPLYFAHVGQKFLFASEPKALLGLYGLGESIHADALKSYLIYRYVSGQQSMWKGIHRLLPGHCLVYDLNTNKSEISRYWHIETAAGDWTESDALQKVEDILHTAVEEQLVSDVPIGTFLSGGIDSTCITGLAATIKPQIDSFSVGFEGSQRSELPTAAMTASAFGTKHHADMVQMNNFQHMEKLFYYFDEPLADTSIFPSYLVCEAARQHTKVVLSGDGGDELFGGYSWYKQTAACSPVKKMAFSFGGLLKTLHADNTGIGRRCDIVDHYLRMTSPGFTFAEMKALFPDVFIDLVEERETYLYKKHFKPELEPYKQWQYVDAHTFLVENNLTKVDRTSMAHSLEVRVPLLDHHLVELAFSLPDNLCVRGDEQKYLLRRLVKKLGAGHVLDKPKQGFSCPVHLYWPTQQMESELLHGKMVNSSFIDRGALHAVINDHLAYNRDYKIWLLAILERWYAHWGMSVSTCAA